MKTWSGLVLAGAAILLELLPVAVAHGNDGEAVDMDMSPAPSDAAPAPMAIPTSYFRHTEHGKMILAHIALMSIGWAFVLPVAVMLSVAGSRFKLPAQLAFLLVNAFGLLTGVIYNHSTPNFFEGEKHSSVGWVITWIASAWVIMGLVTLHSPASNHKRRRSGQAVTAAAMAEYGRFEDTPISDPRRWSGDSGQGSERNSSSLFSQSRSPSIQSENQQLHDPPRSYEHDDEDDEFDTHEKRSFLRRTTVDRFLSRNVGRLGGFRRTLLAIRIVHVLLEKSLLCLGFLGILTGAVIYSGIFHGDSVFNGLAHFIKGGIFFWYGLLTFGRWMGCFADFGWAWNKKPSKEVVGRWPAMMPSAEFIESAVICFYGISNVGLEHLAASGAEWAPIDLEHVSITLMFFGGGLLGMLIESTTIRDLLMSTIQLARDDSNNMEEEFRQPTQWSFSMNPMPALTILLLGVMMGSHKQESMVSTMLHAQWGNLFGGFAIARIATYGILYIRLPVSHLPQRPPTEIVSSFCLVAGGLLFMLSNKDTVAALEYNNLDAMFVFNVVVGFSAFLMAWATTCIAIKGWAQRRVHARKLKSLA
ncbi:hypothetical protein NA57DRAFT_37968 [Rhizodiscina lignyota]|uniref:Integral membrane protein n=1 Tax=Rhizodiscina lignyota TaxID=1504668 RepID=A0A9P4IDW5_9PEZI|nr:hypothetical protein NA57DRAFT_37968 [Rhizodiscina lignyota]